MTEVHFHFNVAERLPYVCRLLRKAVRRSAGVTVTGAADTLVQLDEALWTFEETEFLPHWLVKAGAAVTACQRAAPLWLTEDPQFGSRHPVLLNLGTEPVDRLDSFERLIEVVSLEDADREAARRRWKHYSRLGHPIVKHEVVA